MYDRLSARVNRQSILIVVDLNISVQSPSSRVSRLVTEINWRRAITLHPLICFGLLRRDRRLAFKTGTALRNTYNTLEWRKEESQERSNSHFHYRLLGLVNVL